MQTGVNVLTGLHAAYAQGEQCFPAVKQDLNWSILKAEKTLAFLFSHAWVMALAWAIKKVEDPQARAYGSSSGSRYDPPPRRESSAQRRLASLQSPRILWMPLAPVCNPSEGHQLLQVSFATHAATDGCTLDAKNLPSHSQTQCGPPPIKASAACAVLHKAWQT